MPFERSSVAKQFGAWGLVPAKKESPAEAGQGKVVLEREFKMKLLPLLCR